MAVCALPGGARPASAHPPHVPLSSGRPSCDAGHAHGSSACVKSGGWGQAPALPPPSVSGRRADDPAGCLHFPETSLKVTMSVLSCPLWAESCPPPPALPNLYTEAPTPGPQNTTAFGGGASKEARKVKRGRRAAPILYDRRPYKEMRTRNRREGQPSARRGGGCRGHRLPAPGLGLRLWLATRQMPTVFGRPGRLVPSAQTFWHS